jgi:SRSO17 transposase
LPGETAVEHLVHVAKMRWRIERDYQDLKQESALDTSRDVGGADFTITHRYALPPTSLSDISCEEVMRR